MVTKDVPAWTVVAGNPAKIVRYIKLKIDKEIDKDSQGP